MITYFVALPISLLIVPFLHFMKIYLPVPFKKINFKLGAAPLAIYLVSLVTIIGVYLQPYVPVEQLVRDTVVVAGGKIYFGLISNIGLFLWCASASVCLFTYFFVKDKSSARQRNMVLSGALLSLFLLADDFLMMHEIFFPKYLGLSENVFFVIYPLALISYLIIYLKEILLSKVLLFFSALGFLGFSIISDKILPQQGSIMIVEDGFKFIGITGWFIYFAHVCHTVIKNTFEAEIEHSKIQLSNLYVDSKSNELIAPQSAYDIL